jgi:hypothetical protein
MITYRRGHRSATNPASGESRKIGIWPTKPNVPSSSEEPVRRYHLHPGADQGDELPAEEKLEIPVAQRPERISRAAALDRRRRGAFGALDLSRYWGSVSHFTKRLNIVTHAARGNVRQNRPRFTGAAERIPSQLRGGARVWAADQRRRKETIR